MDGVSHADWEIGRLANRQHGVVAFWQLVELGLGRGAIEHRLRCGRLRRVHKGIYAVGHKQLGQDGIWMAAVLAGGREAALSHWSAAIHLTLRRGKGPLSHVTVRHRLRDRESIRFHVSQLKPDEIIEKEGIPTTSPGRTLVDLAPLLKDPALQRLIERAEQLPWNGPSLPELLDRYARKPGVKRLRALWQAPTQRTRSDFEAEVMQAITAAGLPAPELNQQVQGYEVDLVWREQRVIAEIDTYMTHGNRFAFERDRERDRVLQLANWKVVRFTPTNLNAVIDDLRGHFSVQKPGP
jgi:very-short-patch-repair endonuclease